MFHPSNGNKNKLKILFKYAEKIYGKGISHSSPREIWNIGILILI
jgi:hypothetical protein